MTYNGLQPWKHFYDDTYVETVLRFHRTHFIVFLKSQKKNASETATRTTKRARNIGNLPRCWINKKNVCPFLDQPPSAATFTALFSIINHLFKFVIYSTRVYAYAYA